MTTPAVVDGDAEITEFESMDVDLLNGVKSAANGAPHLLMKGLGDAAKADNAPTDAGGDDGTWRHDPMIGDHEHAHPSFGAVDADEDGMHGHAHSHGRNGSPDAVHDHPHPAAGGAVKAVVNGKVDQRPDIKIADQVLALLGQAMGNESDEVAAGKHDETGDVHLLTRIHEMVQAWRDHEQHPDRGGMDSAVVNAAATGCGCCENCTMDDIAKSTWTYPADDLAKDHREFSADERKKQASQGNALPDGSYPIPDADALRRAAVLARSKHGNWQAARRLIARRAKELGVANPLDDGNDDDASKSTAVADEGADVDTTTQGSDAQAVMAKAVADAVTKATQPVLDRLAAKETELDKLLAKVKATPIPGGPVLSAAAAARPQAQADGEDHAAKSAYFAQMAETVSDPKSADGYRILARQHAEKARGAATPASST